MPFFEPDRFFSSLTAINIQHDLLDAGLTHVLLDIDNTIRRFDTAEVPRDVRAWLARAREAGVQVCLLSNNWHANAPELARELELPIVAKACKPLPFGYLRALKVLGATKHDTAAIGDQLVTDVIGAHLVGMRAFLVRPLVNVELPQTAFMRNVERALMGAREPEGASININLADRDGSARPRHSQEEGTSAS